MFTTDTGIVVPGITARLSPSTAVVGPVNINANASENVHWNVPYSLEANKKLKLISSINGTKSNSNTVALFNGPVLPPQR